MRSAPKRKRESLPALVLIVLLAIMLVMFSYFVGTDSRTILYDPPSLTNR